MPLINTNLYLTNYTSCLKYKITIPDTYMHSEILYLKLIAFRQNFIYYLGLYRIRKGKEEYTYRGIQELSLN